MTEPRSTKASVSSQKRGATIMEKLPPEAQKWAESLPWNERRYLLSLCHLMCAATPEMQAEFLDDYTANGLVARRLQDKETQQRVQEYLKEFHISLELNESVVRNYIKQFYVHSAQDTRRKADIYLESALKLVVSAEDRTNVFNYILGFELLKMMFQMSWLEHERLYQLQINQEDFFNIYIKPIQHAHKVNNIILVKTDRNNFFAKRNYFVQKPNIPNKRLIELVIATFPTDIVTNFGASIIRNIKSLSFDYEYIFSSEQEDAFPN